MSVWKSDETLLSICILNFSFKNYFVWEEISNIRHSVSSPDETPRSSSKILRCASYFQLSSRCFIWWWNTASLFDILREHIQGFFYTKESPSFVKPSSFKSRALKFPAKSIINAVLSTNLLLFFSCSRPPISLPLHTHMQTHSRTPWFDLTKGLCSKRLLFNTCTVLKLT